VAAHLTVSVGVAELRDGGPQGSAALLAAADAALYRAKQQGRHRALLATTEPVAQPGLSSLPT
jgi:PleD family two-component response regulator